MASEWIQDSLTICGQEVQVKRGSIPQRELQYFPENPRIYSIIRAGEVTPTQSEIEERLAKLDHVKQLVQSIRATGGLTDPLIVRDGDMMVLEGNSRLAAYRVLDKTAGDPIIWGTVKVTLLPADIADSLVFALLGQYHIIGRKDWQPYEQAGYLYRRVAKHDLSPSQIASELGISSSDVKRLVDVYQFMVDHDEASIDRWSYYEEYLKSRYIKKARIDYPNLDKRFVKAVKSREIPLAIDVRNKMITIAKGGDRSLKLFLSDDDTFERAYLSAVDRGADNTLLAQFKRFRQTVVKSEVVKNLSAMQPEQRQKSLYELRKIQQRLGYILKRLD